MQYCKTDNIVTPDPALLDLANTWAATQKAIIELSAKRSLLQQEFSRLSAQLEAIGFEWRGVQAGFVAVTARDCFQPNQQCVTTSQCVAEPMELAIAKGNVWVKLSQEAIDVYLQIIAVDFQIASAQSAIPSLVPPIPPTTGLLFVTSCSAVGGHSCGCAPQPASVTQTEVAQPDATTVKG